MKQNRVNSWLLWTALVALVGFLLGNYGLYDLIGLTGESYQTLCNLTLAVLIALGVINNPESKDKL
jgi:uncharacterized membrane protein